MAGIYVYSERASLAGELIGLAKKMAGTAAVIALNQDQANSAAQYGADKVCYLKGDNPLAENYAKAVAEFLKNEEAELFLVGATSRGRDIAARVAGYLECGMVSDICSIGYEKGQVSTERIMYGGAVVQSELIEGMAVVTVPEGIYPASIGGTSEIEIVNVQADTRVLLEEKAPRVRAGVDLSAADKVICIGLGMEKKEDMQIALDLAQVLGAELSCTRTIAEERRWLPNYIGISGVTVKPSLYLSMGVSGQVQHVAGIRDSKLIVAIDLNEKAPIFNAADYGIVGDMFEIVPLLTHELKKA